MVVLKNYLRCVQRTQRVDGGTKELSKVCATYTVCYEDDGTK